MPWTARHQLPQPILRQIQKESHGTRYDDRTGHRQIDVSGARGCCGRRSYPGGNGAPAIGSTGCAALGLGQGMQTQFTFAAAQVPEPASLTIFGLGLLALGALRRRRVRSAV